jgi:seryl-tRNA synthetase
MLDLKAVRENLPATAAALKKRGFEFDVPAFEGVEKERRAAITEAERLKAAKNELSRAIGDLKKSGKDAAGPMEQVKALGEQLGAAEARAAELDQKLYDALKRTPNLPDASVPEGLDAAANVEVKAWGTPPGFDFAPKPHWELGEQLGILD